MCEVTSGPGPPVTRLSDESLHAFGLGWVPRSAGLSVVIRVAINTGPGARSSRSTTHQPFGPSPEGASRPRVDFISIAITRKGVHRDRTRIPSRQAGPALGRHTFPVDTSCARLLCRPSRGKRNAGTKGHVSEAGPTTSRCSATPHAHDLPKALLGVRETARPASDGKEREMARQINSGLAWADWL